MISFVRTKTDYIILKNFEWINLNVSDESHITEVMMTGTGQWKRTDTNDLIDSVCVMSMQLENSCKKCADDAFCHSTNITSNAPNCICPTHRRGLNCEIDLCSKCQNNTTKSNSNPSKLYQHVCRHVMSCHVEASPACKDT